jgi:hypothetical protein
MNYFQLLLALDLLAGIGPPPFFSREGLPEFDRPRRRFSQIADSFQLHREVSPNSRPAWPIARRRSVVGNIAEVLIVVSSFHLVASSKQLLFKCLRLFPLTSAARALFVGQYYSLSLGFCGFRAR